MNTEKPEAISLFCLTPGGIALANRIRHFLPVTCYCSEKYRRSGFTAFTGSFADTLADRFAKDSAIIVIGAVGIVVRVLAPHILDKYLDPAVIVIDERGKNVISLLSGHVGGANKLTRYLAGVLGGNPVITTSTDVNKMCSLDTLVQEIHGWCEDERRSVKMINQMLVSEKKVGIYVDPDYEAKTGFQLDDFDTRGLVRLKHLEAKPLDLSALIYVSIYRSVPYWHVPVTRLVPKRVVCGIGCRKGTSQELLSSVMAARLAEFNLDPNAVSVIGSIELKKDESAILALADEYQVPFELFSVDELTECDHLFEKSDFVEQIVGVGSVSQPVAWLLSNGNLIGDTYKSQGITLTLGVAQ